MIGKFAITEIGTTKNKRGEIKTKQVVITNRIPRKGMTFNTINSLYKELSEKYGSSGMTITGKCMDDHHKTLKHADHYGTNLKYFTDEYFDNKPHIASNVKDRLQGHYYSIEVTYNL